MREPILKAVAQPPKVFWAPVLPMVANFAIEMALMIMIMGAFPGKINPIFFIFTFLLGHIFIVILGVKEPCLSKILQSFGTIKSNWSSDGKLNKSNLSVIPKNLPMDTENASKLIQTTDDTLTAVLELSVPNNYLAEDIAKTWHDLFLDIQNAQVILRVFQDNYRSGYTYLFLSAKKNNVADLNRAIFNCLGTLEGFRPVLLSDTDSEHLIQDMLQGEISFNNNSDIFSFDNGRRYGAYVGLVHIGDEMNTQMLENIMALRYQITIQHNLRPLTKYMADMLLIQQRKMAYFTAFSQNVYNQYSNAIEAISSDYQVLMVYALNFFVSGSSANEVEQGVKEVINILSHYRFIARKEGPVAQETFLNQFPPFNIYPRERTFLSGVVATALSGATNSL